MGLPLELTPTIASVRCTVVDIKFCPVSPLSCASVRTAAVGMIHCAAHGVSPEAHGQGLRTYTQALMPRLGQQTVAEALCHAQACNPWRTFKG